MIKYLSAGFPKITEYDKLLYRAISIKELKDILLNGLRNKPGAYETGKLFAPTLEEAAQFGKNNFGFDNEPNSLIVIAISDIIYRNSDKFVADGMNAVLFHENYLTLIKVTVLNYSQII